MRNRRHYPRRSATTPALRRPSRRIISTILSVLAIGFPAAIGCANRGSAGPVDVTADAASSAAAGRDGATSGGSAGGTIGGGTNSDGGVAGSAAGDNGAPGGEPELEERRATAVCPGIAGAGGNGGVPGNGGASIGGGASGQGGASSPAGGASGASGGSGGAPSTGLGGAGGPVDGWYEAGRSRPTCSPTRRPYRTPTKVRTGPACSIPERACRKSRPTASRRGRTAPRRAAWW